MKYVYLINEVGTDNYKIGKATNTTERMSTLQTGNSNILALIASFDTRNYTLLEKMLHKHFKNNNIINEWFKFDKNELCDVLDTANKFCSEINKKNSKNKNSKNKNNKNKIEYKCNNCDKTFARKFNFDRHVGRKLNCADQIIKNGTSQCDMCKKEFKYNTSLYRHIKSCKSKQNKIKSMDVENKNINHKKIINDTDKILQITKKIETFDKDKIDLCNKILDLITA